MINQTGLTVGLAMFLLCVLVGGILNVVSGKRHPRTKDVNHASERTDSVAVGDKQEISRLKDLEREAVELRKESDVNRTRAAVSGNISLLKQRARDIKRACPSADFNKRPMFKPMWSPTANSPLPDWYSDASDWHAAVLRLPRAEKKRMPYLCSLDFDEVMEFLDDADIEGAGRAVERDRILPDAPEIAAEWGQKEGKCGLFLWNNGGMAVEAGMLPSQCGDRALYWLRPPIKSFPPETDRYKEFVPLWLSTDASGLGYLAATDDSVRQSIPLNKNGWRAPVAMRIICQDLRGGWYVMRHDLTIQKDGSVSVAYINCEILSMPPCG
ncbi:MAG: hypothetical protein ACLQU1_27955 [Bryobacteraceae bacterium]